MTSFIKCQDRLAGQKAGSSSQLCGFLACSPLDPFYKSQIKDECRLFKIPSKLGCKLHEQTYAFPQYQIDCALIFRQAYLVEEYFQNVKNWPELKVHQPFHLNLRHRVSFWHQSTWEAIKVYTFQDHKEQGCHFLKYFGFNLWLSTVLTFPWLACQLTFEKFELKSMAFFLIMTIFEVTF